MKNATILKELIFSQKYSLADEIIILSYQETVLDFPG